MTIAIDFDGTITQESNFPYLSELKPFAKEAISKLRSKGHKLYLWTCRAGLEFQEAVDFLKGQGIELDGYNICKCEYGNRKMICDLYIDDRSYPLREIDWKEIYESITGEKLSAEEIK